MWVTVFVVLWEKAFLDLIKRQDNVCWDSSLHRQSAAQTTHILSSHAVLKCMGTHVHLKLPYHTRVVNVLLAPSTDNPLPQFQWDVGDMVRAGDGWAMERSQVWRMDCWPACSFQVYNYQLFFCQHHHSRRVIKLCRNKICWGWQKWPSKINRNKLPVRFIWKLLSQRSTQTFLLAKPPNAPV